MHSIDDCDPVFIRIYSSGSPWVLAVITEATGPISYKARALDGTIVHQQVDQVRGLLHNDDHVTESVTLMASDTVTAPDPGLDNSFRNSPSISIEETVEPGSVPESSDVSSTAVQLRHSNCVRTLSRHLQDNVLNS